MLALEAKGAVSDERGRLCLSVPWLPKVKKTMEVIETEEPVTAEAHKKILRSYSLMVSLFFVATRFLD